MPSFHERHVAAAPPEEVWKILYDPARFADWWTGEDVPVYRSEQPGGGRVLMSCLKTDARFEWRLESVDAGAATRINVDVDIPPADAHLLEPEREVVVASLERLATLAREC